MTGGLRRGFVLLTCGQVVFLIAGYVVHIVLARGLGPAEYGSYGIMLSVLSTVALVLTSGMPEAIARFASERPAEANGIFAQGIGIQLRFSLLLCAAYALCSPLIGLALRDGALTPALAASALAVPPVALYAVVVGALNGQRRFAAQALTVGGYGALRASMVIALAPHFKIAGAVAGFVLAPTVIVALALPGILRRRTASRLASRELWVFARPVIGFTIALNLLMTLDLFVVKAVVRDAESVGYYAAATTVAKVPYFFFSALGTVLLPIVSSAGEDSREQVLHVVRNAIRLIFAVSLGVVAVVAPFSRSILHMLYGQRYGEAALPLGLLVLAMTLFTLTYTVAYALNGLGQPRPAMRLTAVGLVFEGVLAIVLTPVLGPVGAATASCFASLGILAGLLRYARPFLGTPLPLKSLLRVSLAFGVTGALGLALPHARPVHLLLSIPVALVYVATLLVSREFTLQELASWVRREPG